MKVVEIAVKRPVTVWMFTAAIILFGLVSLSRLSVNLLPELSYPTLTIRTDYEGAAPRELEQLVSKPIEETIGVVKGVRQVQSISKAGRSDVVLEFEWGTEMDLASLEVREKLDVMQLPLDVKKPLLLRFNPSLDPIMRFGLQLGENSSTDLKTLRTFAEEEIKRKLESVIGVASVKLGGGLEQQIHVLVDQHKASQLGISLATINQRLTEENLNQSGGKVKSENQEYLVRTINQFQTVADIENVFIAHQDGKNIRLADIATVHDRFKERDSITRINGAEAIEIAIYKEGDANTVAVANAVKVRINELQGTLPDSHQLIEVYDQSTFIAGAISEVKSAAIMGGALAMVILYFFLRNVWSTIIISISIPVSVIATFNLMYGNDISLNIMSLGGIALAVGLLVDNSIVVLENIARKKEESGESLTNAVDGTKEVSGAILASTLTTMAVFFPLVFVEGIAGQLFSDQALTVTFSLLSSLIVALTVIPMLSAKKAREQLAVVDDYIKPVEKPVQKKTGVRKALHFLLLPFKLIFNLIFKYIPGSLIVVVTALYRGISHILSKLLAPVLWAFDKFYNALAGRYRALLRTSLNHRTIAASLILIVTALSFSTLYKVGMELIPRMSQGEFIVEITLPPGSHLDQTDNLLQNLAKHTESHELVSKTFSIAGTGSLMNASPAQGGDNWGRLNVVMKDGSTGQNENEVMAHIRARLANMAGVQSQFSKPELFSFKTPLEIEVRGYNLNALKQYSTAISEALNKTQQFTDIEMSLRTGQPEIKIHFDHERISQLGLSAPAIAKHIAGKIHGTSSSKFNVNDRKIDILVRIDEQERNSVQDIKNLIVNPSSNQPIPLSAVADIEMSVGPSEITRISQERVALVTANLNGGDLKDAMIVAQEVLNNLPAPLSLTAKISGQSEEMENSFKSLQFALLLAVFMVYIVMASQFESLLHPLLILFTVPLATAGSILGLFLTGTNLSVIVFIGLIMLTGIVVNNAIVLVDRINQLRASGMEKISAIQMAAETRFRPILMTTLTTVLGLLPLAISLGEGGEMRAPMAITVIFGLLFATVLTLVFIPVIYSVFDRKTFKETANEQ
ncbi:efflux RND transporter permease subunit [Flocculibacter collagenilyticus]|uniref:efflux RND transporter permease subunit n=1 Tax=Flocculibacter collagenilyticus TaxID=2744479 RepID=UPI0018F511E9|nr:efflux RND transporter permease subunit [Flocculibacter collagenilyticus]